MFPTTIVKRFTIITNHKLATFFCLIENNFPQIFFLEIVFPQLFHVWIYLMIKSQKQSIRICQMIHNLHRELSTFTDPLTSFGFDEKSAYLSKFLQNCVYSTFSRLNLTFLVIKSHKQSIFTRSLLNFYLIKIIVSFQILRKLSLFDSFPI